MEAYCYSRMMRVPAGNVTSAYPSYRVVAPTADVPIILLAHRAWPRYYGRASLPRQVGGRGGGVVMTNARISGT